MKRLTVTMSILVILITLWSGSVFAQKELPDSLQLREYAIRFVNQLIDEDFKAAVSRFDSTMTALVPDSALRQGWQSLLVQAGPFQKQLAVRNEKSKEYDIVIVTCQFENIAIDIKVVFDTLKQISGMWFLPAASSVEYEPPEYVDEESFREEEVTFGDNLWLLPGVLSLPEGEGPFPALVLVHGSGPNDRDETVGPNKPFKDLAGGLTSQKIAVLRYDKRTRVYGEKMVAFLDSFTVQEETIDDALAAVEFLRARDDIRPEAIYLLGHSLGGMLIPRIAEADPDISGFIIMAGSLRPLEDLLWDQYNYIFSLDDTISNDEQQELDKLKVQIALVKDLDKLDSVSARDLPLGIAPYYWRDMRNYNSVEAAKKLERPTLVIHGGRDYQVTIKDFKDWKDVFSGRENVEFKLYSKLSHLFITGESKCTPAEYLQVGHVDSEVITDIARWIHDR